MHKIWKDLAPPAETTQRQRNLDVMIGSLGTAWIGIINYSYESSSGYTRKTELLAQAPAVQKWHEV